MIIRYTAKEEGVVYTMRFIIIAMKIELKMWNDHITLVKMDFHYNMFEAVWRIHLLM